MNNIEEITDKQEILDLLEKHKSQYEYGLKLAKSKKEAITNKIVKENIDKQLETDEKILNALVTVIEEYKKPKISFKKIYGEFTPLKLIKEGDTVLFNEDTQEIIIPCMTVAKCSVPELILLDN